MPALRKNHWPMELSQMSAEGRSSHRKDRINSGRIGENIVTNELLMRGFLVTHLDKGTRGVSANADLLVGHSKMEKPALLQVKASIDRDLNHVFLGSPPSELLAGLVPFYNGKPGFRADFLAAVVMTDARNYRIFIVPIGEAERLVTAALRKWHAVPTRAGHQRKPLPKIYALVNPSIKKERAGAEAREIFGALSQAIMPYEDQYDLLFRKQPHG